MSMVDRAKEKAGPLPVYGWALLIGAGIAIIIWYRNKHAAASSNSTPNDITSSSGTGVSQDQYSAGEIAADYDLRNQLGLNRGTEATLASNVGKEITVDEANTRAVKANTGATNTLTKTDRIDMADDKRDIKTDQHKPVRRRHPVGRGQTPVRKRNSG